MDWGDVQVLLAVMRNGSFGKAALSLGVSHPTVGRRIKALEDEAQQALFRRTTEGLVLTDAGDFAGKRRCGWCLRACEACGSVLSVGQD